MFIHSSDQTLFYLDARGDAKETAADSFFVIYISWLEGVGSLKFLFLPPTTPLVIWGLEVDTRI